MCQYSSVDGFANDWHLVHLGARAVGGAALIIQEATAVSPEGRISYGDMGLWKDAHIEKLKQITTFIHSQGAFAGIQLAHAGRKASMQKPWEGNKQILPEEENGWQSVSSGNIPYHVGEHPPHELTKEEIKNVIGDFVKAAERAEKAGFDVVEVHAAHGYLLHQFYSPLSNRRNDGYGGSFENRVRLVLEITGAVRKAWPQGKPIFVRISASDWTEGGWTIEDSVRLAPLLKSAGADLIDCSSGGNVPNAKITAGPGYQVPFASQIKKQTGVPTAAVGLITEPEQAEKILENGDADLIMIARESLRDPNFPLRAAHELDEKISWPLQYERGKFRS
jgi:2,4-dienoyl-CoA reductase-like NADH-dependent reductase (Old Yellow Enzyme family)